MAEQNSVDEPKKEGWLKKNKEYFWPALHFLGDLIAIGLWAFHLIPVKYTETGESGSLNKNGLAAIILIGLALIASVIVNLIIWIKSLKERTSQNAKYENDKVQLNLEIDGLKKEIEEEQSLAKRNKRFTEAFRQIKQINSQIHNIGTCDEPMKLTEIFKDYCNSLSKVFNGIIGLECHVCVKTFVKDEIDKLTVRTFTRDKLRMDRDNVDHKTNIVHTIEHNTDFKHIIANLETGEHYFLCNDLVSFDNYMNTSFLLQKDTHTFTSRSLSERDEKWPLPYKSTIVVPICPDIYEERKADKVIGFLCVDCINKNAFQKEIDLEILFSCADLIYNPLKTILTKKKPHDEEAEKAKVTSL